MLDKNKKPNFVVIMADQFTIRALNVYGSNIAKTPNIDKLAREGILFQNTICPSPICAPSRAAFFAGKHINRIGVYDNASPFKCDEPTFLHYLEDEGYKTIAAGKLHFVGPDQLHGFGERITSSFYPGNMVWVDDWEKSLTIDGGNNRNRLKTAGIKPWNRYRIFDELVEFRTKEWLRKYGKEDKSTPFFMFVTFTHPHDPFQTTKDYWNRYQREDISLPANWEQNFLSLSQMNHWIQKHHDFMRPGEIDNIIKARHSYFANCSYIDDKVGEIIEVLEKQDLRDNTIIIFTSDHGEMLGEHGMWFKRSFYESSVKVPLIINFPNNLFGGKKVNSVVSLLDVYPTILNIAGASIPDDIDGQSLYPVIKDDKKALNQAFSEFLADGVKTPCRMIQRGSIAYHYIHGYKGELYDYSCDPEQMNNLIDSQKYNSVKKELKMEILKDWDPEKASQKVRDSQKRRRFIAKVRLKNKQKWEYIVSPDKPHNMDLRTYVGCGKPLENNND